MEITLGIFYLAIICCIFLIVYVNQDLQQAMEGY